MIAAYTYDKNNRVVTESKIAEEGISVTTFTYDPNGNTLTERTELYKDKNIGTLEPKSGVLLNSPSVKTSEYNMLNQLIKVTTEKGTCTYTYDATGLRFSKSGPNGNYRYIWDGQNLIAEMKDGILKATYLYGNGLQIHQKDDATGKKYYYFFNNHSDVTALTDSNGKVLTVYDYGAYGEDNSRGEKIENPFKYFGQYFDEETGSYYLRARYYDPSLMRFTSEDSYSGKAVDPLSLNRYLYCLGNPVLFTDSTGREAQLKDSYGGNIDVGTIVSLVDNTPIGLMTMVAELLGADLPRNEYIDKASFLIGLKKLALNGLKSGIKLAFAEGADDAVRGVRNAIKAPTWQGGLKYAMNKIGPKPFADAQAHHMLPWKHKDWFASKGLNVNLPEFGAWVRGGGNGGHQSWSKAYDKVWEGFIEDNPNATSEQVIEFMNKVRQNPKWNGGF